MIWWSLNPQGWFIGLIRTRILIHVVNLTSLSLSLSLYIYIYIYIYIRIFNFIYSFSTNKTLMLTHITAYLWKILKKIMFLSIYSKQWWLIRWKDDDYTNCELENILICYLMKNVFIWCFYRSISWMKIH
jgi:hypothetical protein